MTESGLSDWSIVCVPRDNDKSVADQIISQANDVIEPDFLVLMPWAQQDMTSVTENIIKASKCSVILCKA